MRLYHPAVPRTPRNVRRASLPLALALSLGCAAPAFASPFSVGLNIGASHARGAGTAKDFGLTGRYRFNRYAAAQLGYESITSYEMTLFSLAGIGRYPLMRRVDVLGGLGVAHWSESPLGRPMAHGVDPLAVVGLTYRVNRQIRTGVRFQFIHGGGSTLQTVMLDARYRIF